MKKITQFAVGDRVVFKQPTPTYKSFIAESKQKLGDGPYVVAIVVWPKCDCGNNDVGFHSIKCDVMRHRAHPQNIKISGDHKWWSAAHFRKV